MSETVERTSLDLRYQTYRLRNDVAEARLLASIVERGIEQPLSGVDTPQGRLLLARFPTLPLRHKTRHRVRALCLPGQGGSDGHRQVDACRQAVAGQRHRFTRELFALSPKVTRGVFVYDQFFEEEEEEEDEDDERPW